MVNTRIRVIIFFVAKDGEAIWSAKASSGADCGSDHELLIAKFRLKLKKGENSTRPFRYDLNQVPYVVEVSSRFRGLDLLELLENHGQKFTALDRSGQDCLQEKEMQEGTAAVRGTLPTAVTGWQGNSFHV